jgi:hypothetical protein
VIHGTYLDTERVVVGRVGRVQRLALDVVAPPAVVVGVGAKVQRARDNVAAALLISGSVTARLRDVDLTGARPWAVCVVLGQHPNSGPQPVTRRQLGDDLDSAVLY